MSNPFYNHGGYPATRAAGASASMRAELDNIEQGFDKLAPLTPSAIVAVNETGSAQEALSPATLMERLGAAPITAIQDGDYVRMQNIAGTDAITADVDPALTAYAAGQLFYGIAAATITGASTLSLNGLPAVSIKCEGTNTVAGEIAVGKPFLVLHDGMNFQLLNPYTGLFLRETGGSMSGALNMGAAVNEAMAMVVSDPTASAIWSASGNQLTLTGSATITDFPDAPQAGATRWLYPDAGIKLTNNANIAVQGGADRTAEAGELWRITALTPSTFKATIFKADGSALVTATAAPSRRQTVLSGPVDSNGFPNFGGTTGSATLTLSGTLKVTAAAGGDDNFTGQITNPAFTAPAGSGTGFLMLAVNSSGVVTASVRTLAPVQQYGGSYSTVNGQHTFNTQEMIGKVGNGTVANQVYEVPIGECSYTSGAWSGTPLYYQLKRQYNSGWFNVATATTYNKAANLGIDPTLQKVTLLYRQSSSYVPRVMAGVVYDGAANTYGGVSGPTDRNNIRVRTGTGGVAGGAIDASTAFGANDGSTTGSGQYCIIAEGAF